MENKKIIKLANNYMEYVSLTDKLFKNNYNIKIPPIIAAKSKKIIPLKGFLKFKNKRVQYRFHGLGCCFIFDEYTVIDFNYKPPNWEFGGIVFYNFWEFVKKRAPEYEDENILKEELLQLENEKVIRRDKDSIFVFYLNPSYLDDSSEYHKVDSED